MIKRIEQWRSIPEYLDYIISEYGRIIRLFGGPAEGQLMEPSLNDNGYLRVTLSQDGISKKYSVARLVYEAFVGPIPYGYDIHHKDGNKLNNHYSNLELVLSNLHKSLHRNGFEKVKTLKTNFFYFIDEKRRMFNFDPVEVCV